MSMRTCKPILIILSLALLLSLAAGSAQAIRIKDLASFKGVRHNQLIGYGLVVGLNGTGDKASTVFTNQGLSNMLNRLGVQVTSKSIAVKNVAAVMVTAKLPPFARLGQRIDVTLSSMGDCSSLAGGTLIMTPLKALDNNVYVMAQGAVSVGGFSAGGEAAEVTKNHPTVGRIPKGGLVERELGLNMDKLDNMSVNLDVPDFTTAYRVATKINEALPSLHAYAQDPSTISVKLPPGHEMNRVEILARLENLEVIPDQSAKVIVDERTGTVVMGEKVRISTVAVASGALAISITESKQVSQALPFAQGGQTVVTPSTDVKVGEDKAALRVLQGGVSIGEVVRALNALGATPRDLITILQTIKAAGALQADLEII